MIALSTSPYWRFSIYCLTIFSFCSVFIGVSSFSVPSPRGNRPTSQNTAPTEYEEAASHEISSNGSLKRTLLIHWKGERDVGYSKPFRHIEFISALAAELDIPPTDTPQIVFVNALNYTGSEKLPPVRIEHFNEAMQYITLPENDTIVTREGVIAAVERCSLVHALYEVIAVGNDYRELSPRAIDNGGFQDMYKGGPNEAMSWCFRVRNFSDLSSEEERKDKRDGALARARSTQMEKAGLAALKDLLILFEGKVDLRNPECQIYLFDGFQNIKSVLARRIAVSPKISVINPNTRICVTNTPLEPIAAFSLCNVARIPQGGTVLDPYVGSGATLLAAAMIAPTCQTVGIEIARNGMINRDNMSRDFSSRNLQLPKALIHGDSTDPDIRSQARAAIGGHPFDAIVADPPYGIRETASHNELSPLEEMFSYITKDRESGSRILKRGGRLVVFVPVPEEETLSELLPNADVSKEAGLQFEASKEQKLNDKLSRWLVSFVCIK